MTARAATLEPQSAQDELSEYRSALSGLNRLRAPYLVGGTHAFSHYTGIVRPTKDLDLFVRRRDRGRVLRDLERLGWDIEETFPHWLSKAHRGQHSIDVLHGASNGIVAVDDEWFEHARPGLVAGAPVRFAPPEEMIWAKAFVMEKYRFDGADVAHLLLRQGHRLDWLRLRRRFVNHWQVLLAHLVLFQFVYPGQDVLPPHLVEGLARRAADRDVPPEEPPTCRGVLLSRKQYRVDTETWGMWDVRRDSDVAMSDEDIARWTAARPGPPGPDALA